MPSCYNNCSQSGGVTQRVCSYIALGVLANIIETSDRSISIFKNILINTHGHIWNYHFRWPRLRYTSNKIVGVVVRGLGWSTGTVADTCTDGHKL